MTRVIAHRGARSLAPENTLIAAKRAYQIGADLWETDVNITKDGRLVLFHDETLLRCTNAAIRFPSKPSYSVTEFSLKEIQMLDAGSYFIETDPFDQISEGNVSPKELSGYKSAAIPSLEQGLEFTIKMNWKINLELKFYPGHILEKTDFFIPDKTLEVINQSGISHDQLVVSSFNHSWLRYIIKTAPQIEVQALVGDNDIDPLDFGDFEFPAYNANAKLINDRLIRQIKSRGKQINLFTVNNPNDFSRFVHLGVDGIFTDFPQLFC